MKHYTYSKCVMLYTDVSACACCERPFEHCIISCPYVQAAGHTTFMWVRVSITVPAHCSQQKGREQVLFQISLIFSASRRRWQDPAVRKSSHKKSSLLLSQPFKTQCDRLTLFLNTLSESEQTMWLLEGWKMLFQCENHSFQATQKNF